jgi:hypothetical protein
VFCHSLAIIAASLSVIRGVATIEPVNRVIVPILLAIVTFSFYWALFLPSAADGIIHMFRPNWGTTFYGYICNQMKFLSSWVYEWEGGGTFLPPQYHGGPIVSSPSLQPYSCALPYPPPPN